MLPITAPALDCIPVLPRTPGAHWGCLFRALQSAGPGDNRTRHAVNLKASRRAMPETAGLTTEAMPDDRGQAE